MSKFEIRVRVAWPWKGGGITVTHNADQIYNVRRLDGETDAEYAERQETGRLWRELARVWPQAWPVLAALGVLIVGSVVLALLLR